MEISYSVNQDIALLTYSLIPGLQAVFRKPGHLHCGVSGMTEWLPSPPKTGPGSQLFRTKAFKGSMPQIHMLIRDVILCLQCEHFYLITCLDNLSDSRLIPLVVEFPPKITLGFFLSVFYFLAPKIMKLTRGAREYPQKIRVCPYNIVLPCEGFPCYYFKWVIFYVVCHILISLRCGVFLSWWI